MNEIILTEEQQIKQFEEQYKGLMLQIADVVKAKKAAEKAEKDMKEELQKALNKYGFVGLENDILKITYVEPTTKTAIDSKAVKRKYPKVFEECSKTSPVKGYIKIQVKGVED